MCNRMVSGDDWCLKFVDMKFIEGKFLKGGVLFSHTPCDHGKICTFPTAFQLRCDDIATSFHQAEVTWCCPREICEGHIPSNVPLVRCCNEVMTICSFQKALEQKGIWMGDIILWLLWLLEETLDVVTFLRWLSQDFVPLCIYIYI